MTPAERQREYRQQNAERIRLQRRTRRTSTRVFGYDDDDRGLRRLLIDLGLPRPPDRPAREVVRLTWVGRCLAAVVVLPPTSALLEWHRRCRR